MLIKPMEDFKPVCARWEPNERFFNLRHIVDGHIGEHFPELFHILWVERTSGQYHMRILRGVCILRGNGLILRKGSLILWVERTSGDQLTTLPYFPLTAQSWPEYSTSNHPLGKVKPKKRRRSPFLAIPWTG